MFFIDLNVLASFQYFLWDDHTVITILSSSYVSNVIIAYINTVLNAAVKRNMRKIIK